MDLEELESTINRLRSRGRVDDSGTVKVRNPHVSDEAIEAGSDGWIEVGAVLVIDGDIHLEPEED